MKQGTKKNEKSIMPIITIVLLVIILVIVLIIKGVSKNNDDNPSNTDSQAINNSEYDGNPYTVPQDYTQTVEQFVDESGAELDEATALRLKEEMRNKFLEKTPEELGIKVDMSNIQIIFNQGTTKVSDNTCFVFSVYEPKGDTVEFVSKFAMSLDTQTLYKYDSESLVFNMIK